MVLDRLRMGKGKIAVILKGLLLASAATTVILLLLAFIMLKFQPDLSGMEIGIYVAYVLSCFTGGWYVGRKAEKKRYLWGMLLGLIYFVLLAAVSGMENGCIEAGLTGSIAAAMCCLAGGMAGGMIS